MTKQEIDEVLDRVRTWPKEKQEDAVQMLRAMDDMDGGVYHLTPEEESELAEAEGQADRGEFATEEEMKALFDRYRNP